MANNICYVITIYIIFLIYNLYLINNLLIDGIVVKPISTGKNPTGLNFKTVSLLLHYKDYIPNNLPGVL